MWTLRLTNHAEQNNLADRWDNFMIYGWDPGPAFVPPAGLSILHNPRPDGPTLLKGVYVDRFQAEFATAYVGTPGSAIYSSFPFVFDAADSDNYNALTLSHNPDSAKHGQSAPWWDYHYQNGQRSLVWLSSTDSAMPTLTDADTLWYRITVDDDYVTILAGKQTDGQGEVIWSATPCVNKPRSNFGVSRGGMIGFDGATTRCAIVNLGNIAECRKTMRKRKKARKCVAKRRANFRGRIVASRF